MKRATEYNDLSIRAKRRALHLLEIRDRTEEQLRRKLKESGYPDDCIDEAIDYVKSYHYIDDHRYACNYIRCSMERKSRRMITQKLLERGVSRDLIEEALEEEFGHEESAKTIEAAQISQLLLKRNFIPGQADERQFRQTYQFLMRRGYKSGDIVRAMRPA